MYSILIRNRQFRNFEIDQDFTHAQCVPESSPYSAIYGPPCACATGTSQFQRMNTDLIPNSSRFESPSIVLWLQYDWLFMRVDLSSFFVVTVFIVTCQQEFYASASTSSPPPPTSPLTSSPSLPLLPRPPRQSGVVGSPTG